MLKKISFCIFLTSLISCTQIDPFVFTKRLSPLHNQIKIFWSEDITEVTLNDYVIKKQGVYYLMPKKYNLSWKYKIIKENETVFKWKSSKIDLANTKEIYFEKGLVTKK